jgi:hypothetical protein
MTVPSSGTETSSEPSGAQAASRASGTRANTDIVQPGGTSACRGQSNGKALIPGGTDTVTGTRPAGAAADGAGLPEQAASSATATRSSRARCGCTGILSCRSTIRVR